MFACCQYLTRTFCTETGLEEDSRSTVRWRQLSLCLREACGKIPGWIWQANVMYMNMHASPRGIQACGRRQGPGTAYGARMGWTGQYGDGAGVQVWLSMMGRCVLGYFFSLLTRAWRKGAAVLVVVIRSTPRKLHSRTSTRYTVQVAALPIAMAESVSSFCVVAEDQQSMMRCGGHGHSPAAGRQA